MVSEMNYGFYCECQTYVATSAPSPRIDNTSSIPINFDSLAAGIYKNDVGDTLGENIIDNKIASGV